MIPFLQYLSEATVGPIADSCLLLRKLILGGVMLIVDEDVIHVIEKLGKQLTTLVLDGLLLTDIAYSHLDNCAR